jgi:hypothetical protein
MFSIAPSSLHFFIMMMASTNNNTHVPLTYIRRRYDVVIATKAHIPIPKREILSHPNPSGMGYCDQIPVSVSNSRRN